MKQKPVYSTDSGDLRKKNKAKGKSHPKHETGETKKPAVKMRLEKNGRGGKLVTVLFEMNFSDAEAKQLMKEAQGMFGIGATFKGGCIEMRGDVRDRLELLLKSKAIKVTRAGG